MSRFLLSLLFIAAGAMHFISPSPFIRIVPPMLPWPAALVAISGAAEILGGIGLLVPKTRRMAGWWLAALLVAVFPANIYMATSGMQMPGLETHPWAVWMRLPLQFLLIGWALSARK